MDIFYFDNFPLFRPWSVRTYCYVKKAGFPLENIQQVVDLADGIASGAYKGGLRVATELYRGAGLGVYNIADRLRRHGEPIPVEKIRQLCHQIDIILHENVS